MIATAAIQRDDNKLRLAGLHTTVKPFRNGPLHKLRATLVENGANLTAGNAPIFRHRLNMCHRRAS